MDILWHIVYMIAFHSILFFVLTIASTIFIAVFLPTVRPRVGIYYPFLYIFAFLNLFLGSYIGSWLTHVVGERGTATVTGTYATSTRYNDHDVVGYNVLLKTAAGTVVKTSFEDDDFNIYPPRNSVTYPDVEDIFTVYYLPMFPQDFVIVENDDSPWATGLQCGTLRSELNEARRRSQFSPSDDGFRAIYVEMAHRVLDGKCVTDDDERAMLQQELAKLGETPPSPADRAP